MATRVSARLNVDPDSSDDEYDHPQARKFSGLVKKNQTKVIKDAEDKVWKNKILREEMKIDRLCSRINKRTGKRCCMADKYKDIQGRNTLGFCKQHFYDHNTKMNREKKKQNASHPLDPPPTVPTTTTFSSTPATTSPVDDEQLLRRMRNVNPNFQLRDSEIPNTSSTSTVPPSNNNNNNNNNNTPEEERKRKFQEEEAKREKEEEERLSVEFRAAAEKRARILKRLKEQALKEVAEAMAKAGDEIMDVDDEEEPLRRNEVPPNDEPKDKDGAGPSAKTASGSEEELSEIDVASSPPTNNMDVDLIEL
jgi:hypothetical protein